ncbi:hypothetical protein CCAX7_33410 [Capsulimonas corticalis]|uniref:Uncharacterized protein n=1 Tax=Capsulimonas corticalis TaxID=2219043 RepID=A0A402CYN2_9BACT|nr:hypothetical protein [Capsulimonas corticalis]BDI31290.1 hypothetical protein CCAX7_33410 [Capsulimonas corticalis]
MTQNSHPGSPLQARGFSRRAFAQRAPRPKFRPVDTLWLTTLAILSLAATVIRFGVDAIGDIGAFAAAATVAGLYFIGWRVRDRTTGVIAGALLALSLTYTGSLIGHPETAVFTLLCTAAFAAMAGGQLIGAALLAAIASVIRPDGLLLGAALLCMPPSDDSRLRWRPIGLFLITTALGALVAYSLRYAPPALRIGITPILLGQAILGGNAVLAWFLWPFLAELGEPLRRQRWLPFIVWTVLYAAAESLFYFLQPGQSWPPLAPIFALLVAGGMARLIPVLAGEFANPTLRYVLATLAVVSLVGVRVAMDWPHARLTPRLPVTVLAPVATRPAAKPAAPHAAPPPQPATVVSAPASHPAPTAAITPVAPKPVVAAPTTPATPKPAPQVVTAPPTPSPVKPGSVPHHVVKVPPGAVIAQPGAPRISDTEGDNNSVRTYIWKNGHLIKRSPWAIAWDRKQQALAKQREAAAHAAPAPKPATPAPAATHTAPAPHPIAAPAPPKPAPPAPKPIAAAVKPAAKPAVKRYAAKRPVWRPRVRHRSIWAIRWEQAHPKGR